MQMSRLMFVDMPGAERLAMDPEVLLLREGVLLNKSLLDFSRGRRATVSGSIWWCPAWSRCMHTVGIRVRCARMHHVVCGWARVHCPALLLVQRPCMDMTRMCSAAWWQLAQRDSVACANGVSKTVMTRCHLSHSGAR
jgi:hypothetical protein